MPELMQVFTAGLQPRQKTLSPPDNRGGWWPLVRESFSGAWQRNIVELSPDQCLAMPAVFACHTSICSDVAKNRIKLVQLKDGVWQETTNPAYSPVLRKPNNYQTRIQFLESWMNSKLLRGNTYVLKRRDGRGVVTSLYVLNPDRVQPLVSDDGQVFYRLSQDNLSAITESDVIVPAREIIHDRFNCLFHPLVGISPLYANALLATKAQSLEQAAANLAANGIRPGGLITFPGNIPPDEAARIKETWGAQYGGPTGASKLAVLGNAAKFGAMTMTSVDAQVVEQLKYTAEMICSAYHVPPFIIGVGQEPGAGGVQDRTLRYYTQCIQKHFEDIEACLDDGLGMDGVTIGTEFDVDNLLRLDSATQMDVLDKGRNYFTPNDGRAKLGLGPKPGGDSVYRQQQDFSLEALAKRDAQEDPFGKASTAPPAGDNAANDNAAAAQRAMALATIAKGLS
jgi:HK97 family phage portal protein